MSTLLKIAEDDTTTIESTGTHRGSTYSIVRTDDDELTRGHNYEFLLYVDGRFTVTASALEARGREQNAPIPSLEKYAMAFIDGQKTYPYE